MALLYFPLPSFSSIHFSSTLKSLLPLQGYRKSHLRAPMGWSRFGFVGVPSGKWLVASQNDISWRCMRLDSYNGCHNFSVINSNSSNSLFTNYFLQCTAHCRGREGRHIVKGVLSLVEWFLSQLAIGRLLASLFPVLNWGELCSHLFLGLAARHEVMKNMTGLVRNFLK